MNSIWLSPHNDDAVLFGAYTLLREKPLVLTITDSWIQFNRGEECTAEDRWEEDTKAMKILGCAVIRLGMPDNETNINDLVRVFNNFANFEKVYVPALQGGNKDHDLVNQAATTVFEHKCVYYPTYTKTELYTKGNQEIVPTIEEIELKNKALDCYKSQIRINGPHFDAVMGRSEWYI